MDIDEPIGHKETYGVTMKKVKITFSDITEDKHHEDKHPKAPKAAVVIGGGCSGWQEGTDAYWISATGRKYLHRNCAWMSGDCAAGWVYFFHVGGVPGGNYWHYCP